MDGSNKSSSAAPPPGFREFRFEGVSFNQMIGPLFVKRDGADMVMGFRIEQRHCNPAGVAHGGMLMAVADMCAGLGTSLQARIDKFLPTINMNCDFVAPGPLGAWVEGRTEVIRVGRAMAFANVMLRVDGTPILRASAVMKIPSGDGMKFDRAKFIAAD